MCKCECVTAPWCLLSIEHESTSRKCVTGWTMWTMKNAIFDIDTQIRSTKLSRISQCKTISFVLHDFQMLWCEFQRCNFRFRVNHPFLHLIMWTRVFDWIKIVRGYVTILRLFCNSVSYQWQRKQQKNKLFQFTRWNERTIFIVSNCNIFTKKFVILMKSGLDEFSRWPM